MGVSTSQRRRMRQVRRRVGHMPHQLCIAAVWVDQRIVFHFRSIPSRVFEIGDNIIRRHIARKMLMQDGFVQQQQKWLWINQRARLSDIARMGAALTVSYESERSK